MKFLSIALVLIFVLYLIDKHNAWKGAAKIAAVLIALVVLGAAGIFGWGEYQGWRTQKQHEADVAACMKTLTVGAIVFVRTGDEAGNVVKSFCESNPNANIACGIKSDSDGSLTTYAIGDTDQGTPGKVCTAKGWGQDPILASTCNKWETEHPLNSPIDFFDGTDDRGKPIKGALMGSPEGCSGPLEDAYDARMTQYQKEHPGK